MCSPMTASLAPAQMRSRYTKSTPALVKLGQLDLECGLQEPQLHHQLTRHRGGFRNSEYRRKQVRKIEIQVSQSSHQLLDRRRIRIGEVQMTVNLLAQCPPVQLDEWMFLRDLLYHPLRNSRAVAQSRQVQLKHFSAAAHIVHQVKRISFAANKCHHLHSKTSNLGVVYFTSTTGFNVRFILRYEIASKALTLPPISFRSVPHTAFPSQRFATALEDTRTKSRCSISFLA